MANRSEPRIVSRDKVLDEVRQKAADQMGIAVAMVKEEHELNADLNFDSLDIAELVMTLEEHYDIHVPDQSIEKTLTIGLIADVVMELVQQKAVSP